MAGVASLSSGWGILPVPTCVEWRAGTGGARKPLRGLSCFRSGWYIRSHAARILDALKVGRSARAVSVRAMQWAWGQSPATVAQKLVLAALADRADDDGQCYPSIKWMAWKCSPMSERSVRRALADLAEQGFVEKFQRRRHADGSLGTWILRLKILVATDGHWLEDPSGHPRYALAANSGRAYTTKNKPFAREANASLASAPESNERKPRARDPIWDTLVDLFGGEAAGLERGRWNKACQSLKASGATPETLRGAAEAYRTVMPDGTVMTPTALAANWTILTGDAKTADEFQAERIRALVAEVDARNGFQ